MYTLVETPTFVRLAAEVWNEAELMEFKLWLAANPLAGDVIPGAGSLRKVRWARPGMGKRGGARVIYFNQLADGVIALLMVYTKTKFDNLPPAFLLQLKKEFEDV
ncbi:MAG: transcriptional regulator [Hylemonella sp.]|nr:transcriptional regulator [Hylemonella sp.]